MAEIEGNIIFEFDDQTGTGLDESELDEMMERFRKIANEYDYDISSWGTKKSFRITSLNSVMQDLHEILLDKINQE